MEFTNKEFKERINFAAYKTSLRGEHVLGDDYCRMYSDYGSKIHDALLDAGLKRKEIFKVPADFDMQHIMKRERQMHTKFLVTDTVGIAGTSNWAGDYFDGGITGAAFILNQTEVPLERRHFVRDLRCTFLSHWKSDIINYFYSSNLQFIGDHTYDLHNLMVRY
ncbi:hypothetical protein X798_03720 [Onchocerca flexuosa]|uniref:PLD phosphodiesterase domain-containing protein n=1 Tax=Onchocerca flexuosa TaxID=387005 RepID=A0A238BW89_9BILA|nr:hypothetical protein X798_03720 [Onchocerca flexuosa]